MEGRLIDIPYDTSPPIIFTFRQTANVAGGVYDFNPTGVVKTAFNPNRPINKGFLYIFRTISFAMDIAENDYQGAILDQPAFAAYVQSEAGAPAFRESIVLAKYFDNLPYTLSVMGGQVPGITYPGSAGGATGAAAQAINRLLGNVSGSITQTGALLGKMSVTAIIMLTAQEIVDSAYIDCFKRQQKGTQGLREMGREALGKAAKSLF